MLIVVIVVIIAITTIKKIIIHKVYFPRFFCLFFLVLLIAWFKIQSDFLGMVCFHAYAHICIETNSNMSYYVNYT